jgi:diaminohydroxyphosphoribosylaminopyrimidine deaminase/5-amino-6-(5-phosphoribosylamino)uracil reductase
MTEDEKYMWRCIQLAKNGMMTTSPNPMVGAVIVCNGRIIGEGYHIRCGDWHAEVNAVRSVKDQSLLTKSTLYVSLEPCSHQGKTPPCADMIIEKHIPRVVIGCKDPFAKVDGRGIKKLREAGCEVIVGVLEEECRSLNKKFMTFNIEHRPYITLKWAESADGFIAKLNEKTMVSTPYSSVLMHKRRAENNAIMVGTTTAEVDNPKLDVRYWYGKNPVRLVIDRHLKLKETSYLLDNTIPTIVFSAESHADTNNVTYVTMKDDEIDVLHILKELYKRGIQSVLVEGGAKLHQSFIDANVWDEAYIEKGSAVLHEGVTAAVIKRGVLCEEKRIFGTRIYHFRRL